MNARRLAILCAVVAAVVDGYAFGAIRTAAQPWFENVDVLTVSVSPVGKPSSKVLDWDKLNRKVELQFKDAGLHIPNLDIPNKDTFLLERAAQVNDACAWVDVKIRLSKAPQSDLFALCVETKLVRRVILPHRQGLDIAAPLGGVDGEIQFSSEEELASKIEATVEKHINFFINRLETAKAALKARGDDNEGSGQDPGQATDTMKGPNAVRQDTQPRPQQVSRYPYVASKNSEIFHRSTCSSAARIATGNIVGYKSRQEAIEAGKKPCKRCKP